MRNVILGNHKLEGEFYINRTRVLFVPFRAFCTFLYLKKYTTEAFDNQMIFNFVASTAVVIDMNNHEIVTGHLLKLSHTLIGGFLVI